MPDVKGRIKGVSVPDVPWHRGRELLFRVTIADCTVQTFRSGGRGGQKQNKTDSGVRVIHPPSGARGESREERSQHLNKRKAFLRMAESEKFETWRKIEAARLMGTFPKSVNEIVDEQMRPENLVVEFL